MLLFCLGRISVESMFPQPQSQNVDRIFRQISSSSLGRRGIGVRDTWYTKDPVAFLSQIFHVFIHCRRETKVKYNLEKNKSFKNGKRGTTNLNGFKTLLILSPSLIKTRIDLVNSQTVISLPTNTAESRDTTSLKYTSLEAAMNDNFVSQMRRTLEMRKKRYPKRESFSPSEMSTLSKPQLIHSELWEALRTWTAYCKFDIHWFLPASVTYSNACFSPLCQCGEPYLLPERAPCGQVYDNQRKG